MAGLKRVLQNFWLFSLFTGLAIANQKEILSLPSYDLRAIDQAGVAQIGDVLNFEIVGFDGEGASRLRLEVPEGSDSLMELGWYLRKEDLPRLSLVPLLGGERSLPTLLIIKDDEKVGRTEPISIKVQALSEEGEVPETLEPVSLRFPYLFLSLVLLALLAVLIGAVFYLKKLSSRKRELPKVDLPVKPPLPEEVVALRELERLESERLWERGRVKEHYFGVSDIFKTYLGARYEFDASESTTEEVISSLKKIKRAEAQLEEITSLYQRLDLVKFTDLPPKSDGPLTELKAARELVRATQRRRTDEV